MAEIAIAGQTTRCEGPGCRELVEQQPGGHRKRRFCSDDCKQRAYRERKKEKDRRELRARWADLSEETQGYLEWVMSRNDDRLDFVKGIEEAIRRERGHARQAISLLLLGGRLKYASMTDLGISEGIDQWLNYIRGASDEDLAKAIAHGYHQADSLAMAAIEASDTQLEVQMRQRIDNLERDIALRNARIAELEHGQIEEAQDGAELTKEQIQALLYHVREQQAQMSRQAELIAELERTVDEKINKIHKLEESHGSTMFTMNNLLASAQSAQREGTVSPQQLEKDLHAVLMNVASEALLQTSYGQALQAVAEREQELVHLKTRIEKQYERRLTKQQKRIEELEQAQVAQTGPDQHVGLLQRVQELEQELDLERRGSAGVQRRFRDFVRLAHERQARSQDEQPSREELLARLMAAGERLNYCNLLVARIGTGVESWQQFAEQATNEQIGEAVGMAEHYYESLCYIDELEQRSRETAREKQQQKQDAQQQKRVEALEAELGRYRQICDLSDRQRLEEQWMDIGSQIRYRRCVPVDDRVAVGEGEEAWRAFKEYEQDDRLASGIARVRRYAENLVAGDLQAQLKQAQRRIAELERQTEAQSSVS